LYWQPGKRTNKKAESSVAFDLTFFSILLSWDDVSAFLEHTNKIITITIVKIPQDFDVLQHIL
jgi:hypothetical protein